MYARFILLSMHYRLSPSPFPVPVPFVMQLYSTLPLDFFMTCFGQWRHCSCNVKITCVFLYAFLHLCNLLIRKHLDLFTSPEGEWKTHVAGPVWICKAQPRPLYTGGVCMYQLYTSDVLWFLLLQLLCQNITDTGFVILSLLT